MKLSNHSLDAIYAAHSLTGGDCEAWIDVPEDERLGLYYYEWSLLDCDSQIEALWGDDLVKNSDELARKRGEYYQLRKGSLTQSLIDLAQTHSPKEYVRFKEVDSFVSAVPVEQLKEKIRDNLLCYFDPVYDEYFRGER